MKKQTVPRNIEWMRARLAQSSSATSRPSGKKYKRKKRTAKHEE